MRSNINSLIERTEIEAATASLLHLIKVKVTKKHIAKTLGNHPDYPSLLCISDSLSLWNVENTCLRVETSSLNTLPTPFIAQIESTKKSLIVVTEINNNEVKYFSPALKHNEHKSQSNFLGMWRGVALIAKKTPNSGQPNYYIQNMIEKLRVFISILFILIILLFIYNSPFIKNGTSIYLSALLQITNVFGCIFSIILLFRQNNIPNLISNKLCVHTKYFNCNCRQPQSSAVRN